MAIGEGVSGANRADAHVVGVVPGRDFEPQRVADIHTAVAGDACGRCGESLEAFEGIEVGHIFQLGTKYSEELGATFLDAGGRPRPYVMGCYGIGISRIAASAVESYADERGIVWPPAIAPYEVVVLPLRQAGVDVILDDRGERPGVKFNDADLIGFPLRVVVGKGFLRAGELELQVRRDGSRVNVPPEALCERVKALLAELACGEQGAAPDGG